MNRKHWNIYGQRFLRKIFFLQSMRSLFRVLYSSNALRPNTPVNVCIGALIIKEFFAISDDEVVENLMLDPRYQYALHTSSFEEQPLSDKTLTRFRKRCYDYESIHGIDLLHECMTGLGTNIAKLMDISPRVKRMDSMMIAANIRKLSRIELLILVCQSLSSTSIKINAMILSKGWNIIMMRMTIIKSFITVTILML